MTYTTTGTVTEAVRRRKESSTESATPWRLVVDLFSDAEGIQAPFGGGGAAARCRHLERDGSSVE